jgi:hypothetical protein
MTESRSATAPAGSNYSYEEASDQGSAPSTLYARCDASSARAIHARRLRVAAESDVQFLQNRLAKLKYEELKAKTEVQKLKQKAQEVSVNRERYYQSHNNRQDLQDQVDFSKRKEAALIALNKERQAKAVWSSKQKVMIERREAVLNMRKEKEINECRVHIFKEEQRDRNLRQRESIRQLHDMARKRKEQELESRREEIRRLHEEKIEQEHEERIKKEKLAAQLVAQEAQMIYRLKKLHREKQNALRELAASVEGSYTASVSPPRESPVRNDSALPPI